MKTTYRIAEAERALYNWACGEESTATTRQNCLKLGFHIDFRQRDLGAYMDAFDMTGGIEIRLNI